jgi:hypothetical protein
MALEVTQIIGKSIGADNFDVMPTVGGDPVVESGSNTDGEWTKWAGGTQICRSPGFSIDHTEAVGSLYRSATGEAQTWTYPNTFISSPTATGSSTSTFRWVTVVPSVFSANVNLLAGVTGTGGPCDFTAIGRWK